MSTKIKTYDSDGPFHRANGYSLMRDTSGFISGHVPTAHGIVYVWANPQIVSDKPGTIKLRYISKRIVYERVIAAFYSTKRIVTLAARFSDDCHCKEIITRVCASPALPPPPKTESACVVIRISRTPTSQIIFIDPANQPTLLHATAARASEEATRLAAKVPGQAFTVFQSIHAVEARILAPLIYNPPVITTVDNSRGMADVPQQEAP